MIYLSLFLSFFKIGLLAIGGGLATVPFLYELGKKTNWFTTQELTSMIAVSESTPGPIGINMATFTGIQVAGLFGGLVATLGLVLPAFLIILLLADFLKKQSENKWVKAAFSGLRPCVSVLIFSFWLILIYNQIQTTTSVQESMRKAVIFFILLGLRSEYHFHPFAIIVLGSGLGFLLF